MFNSELKKKNRNRLEAVAKKYDEIVLDINKNSLDLYNERVEAIELIERIEEYINKFANTRKVFDKDLEEITLNIKKFNSELKEIQRKSEEALKTSTVVTASGVLTGAGIAALAPTAAMAIATTFGTASTGTAIASLSGAAATNAALSWLGGGALTVGGSGMAGGTALLALAGPIGWTISGVALVGGSIYRGSKNKKIAQEDYDKTLIISREIQKLGIKNLEIKNLYDMTVKNKNGITEIYTRLLNIRKLDYNILTVDEKYQLGTLVNTTKVLSKSLSTVVADN